MVSPVRIMKVSARRNRESRGTKVGPRAKREEQRPKTKDQRSKTQDRDMIVDSHQHFWQVGRFDYPWMSSDLGVLYQDYLPVAFAPILKANGVEKTVLVQASNSIAESNWLLDLADQYRFIAGVVGWVDLMSPTVDQQIRQLAQPSHFKGVRHLVESEPADDWLAQT